MKANLKFLLSLGNAKLVMINTAGKNIFYSKNAQHPFEKDLTKITFLLNNR